MLDTRDIADSKVVEKVRTVEQLSEDQCQRFVTEGLQEETAPLFDTIQKHKLPLFGSRLATKEKSSDKLKKASLTSNCSLFSSLCVSCQDRYGDLGGFFEYGKLISGAKTDLLSYLEKKRPVQAIPCVEALLLDGAAIVDMLKPSFVSFHVQVNRAG